MVTALRITGPSNGRVNEAVLRRFWVLQTATFLRGFRILWVQKNVQIFQYLSSNMLFFPRFVARSKFFSFQARGSSMSFDRPFQGNAEGRIIVKGSLGVLAVATLQCCLFFFEACSWSKALGIFLLLDLHRISFDSPLGFLCVFHCCSNVCMAVLKARSVRKRTQAT